MLDLVSKIEKLTWVTQIEKISRENKAVKVPPRKQLRDDLSSALLNLGYQPNQVKSTLDKLLERDDGEKLGFEGFLRSALNELSGRTQGMGMATGTEIGHG